MPTPEIVMNIVQNEYPYENIYTTRAILKAISKSQSNKLISMPDYILDMGTLEHLTCVLSRKGNSREMMMLWDYIQSVQAADNHPSYHATEGLYESLARAFVSSTRKEDELLFGVLATMEDQGLKPSFIFLRGLSQAMRTRSTIGRLDKASHILLSSHNAQRYRYKDDGATVVRATTSAINTIISGYADLGLFEKAYKMYNYFQDLDCEPDEHTFVFMLEAVAMNLSTAIPRGHNFHGHEWVSAQEEAADILVEEARYRGYQTNKFLVDSYVKVLCTTKNLEKAKNFIVDTVLDAEQNGVRPNIVLKTFSNLAIDFALSGDLEGAHEVSQLCIVSGYNDLPAHVSERIERIKENNLP
jgi:pentatricopeptide repeat protein|eukprot:scaffold1388_cov267-Chaetoceros_neogracile.AAC.65